MNMIVNATIDISFENSRIGTFQQKDNSVTLSDASLRQYSCEKYNVSLSLNLYFCDP